VKQEIVVIIGDSLGAPRPWVGVDLKRTYALQLAAFLGGEFFVANFSASDNSSARSVNESFLRTYIRKADISYAVIHLGIVDCAPRLLSSFERLMGAVAARSRFFNFFFKRYVSLKSRYRFWLTKRFPRTLVPLPTFEANYRCLINELISTNPIRNIYLLDVAYPGGVLLEKSFNILGNINAYNDAIRRVAAEHPALIEVVSVFEQTRANPGWITPEDGHHILPDAHDWIARQLQEKIKLALSGAFKERDVSSGPNTGSRSFSNPHAE
jgi:lysophospholipase L1-like esterase